MWVFNKAYKQTVMRSSSILITKKDINNFLHAICFLEFGKKQQQQTNHYFYENDTHCLNIIVGHVMAISYQK